MSKLLKSCLVLLVEKIMSVTMVQITLYSTCWYVCFWQGIDVLLEIQKEVDYVADQVTRSKKGYDEREKIVQEVHQKMRKLEDK